jgi:hypothetical protein
MKSSPATYTSHIAILYIMGETFGVHDEGQRSWYIAAFSLTVGTFILPAGMLMQLVRGSHKFDRVSQGDLETCTATRRYS